MSRETWAVVAFTALCAAAAVLIPPVPQPLDYHDFADQRTFLGIPNFMDVVSNAAFVAAGLAGLVIALGRRAVFAQPVERIPYAVFFVGLVLTGVGSAYYHLAPDNETLFWDRLPMTIAFMSLIAAQIVDRMSVRAGLALLGPMLAVGVWSVVHWIVTERAGAGNVVPYAVLQVYCMVIVLGMALLHRSRYTRGEDVYWVFAAYLAAKVFETFDREIFDLLAGTVSGHTLKHLAAAASGAVIAFMLAHRTLRADAQPLVRREQASVAVRAPAD